MNQNSFRKKRSTFSKIFSSILTLFLLISLSQNIIAQGTLIEAPDRVDMAYDQLRKILYITSGSLVLRYSLSSNSFLAPFELSGDLKGIDISPDSNTLAVANHNLFGIHLIDLKTEKLRRITYKPGMERGSHSVAFGDNNTLLITSTFDGSTWVPLRKYDLASNTFTSLGSVRNGSMLSASADGTVIGYAESDASNGPFGRYEIAKNNLIQKNGMDDGTGGFNFDIAVNRNGTQYVIINGRGHLTGGNLKNLAIIGNWWGDGPVGAAYNPVKDILYLPWEKTSQIHAYDTNTFQRIASYDVESPFSLGYPIPFYNNGRIKISRDGHYLFVTVNGGVQYVDLSAENPNKLIASDPSVLKR